MIAVHGQEAKKKWSFAPGLRIPRRNPTKRLSSSTYFSFQITGTKTILEAWDGNHTKQSTPYVFYRGTWKPFQVEIRFLRGYSCSSLFVLIQAHRSQRCSAPSQRSLRGNSAERCKFKFFWKHTSELSSSFPDTQKHWNKGQEVSRYPWALCDHFT